MSFRERFCWFQRMLTRAGSNSQSLCQAFASSRACVSCFFVCVRGSFLFFWETENDPRTHTNSHETQHHVIDFRSKVASILNSSNSQTLCSQARFVLRKNLERPKAKFKDSGSVSTVVSAAEREMSDALSRNHRASDQMEAYGLGPLSAPRNTCGVAKVSPNRCC